MMHAVIVNGESTADVAVAKHTIYDSFPFVIGGGILGAVAAVFIAATCGLVLAIANQFSGGELCGKGFSSWAVVLVSAIAGALVLAGGAWLFRLRRWIGTKAAPEDVAHIMRMRTRFTLGAMTVYCVLAPGVWLFVTASANCGAT